VQQTPDAPVPPAVLFFDRSGQPVTSLLYGELFTVRLVGLKPGETVKLEARYKGYRSEAEFEVGAPGTVDLASVAPKSGTYTDADGEGMLWSMKREEKDAPDAKLDVSFTLLRGSAEIASATIERLPVDARAQKTQVTDDGIVGTYSTPKTAKGPSAAVLAFGGSEGGSSFGEIYGSYLASLGYPSLGVAYFGTGALPKDLDAVPLEHLETALKWLAKQKEVDPKRIVVLGYSRGGELALMLGARFPQLVRGVIAVVPSGVRWPSVNDVDKAAWTFGGKALPFIKWDATAKPAAEKLLDGTIGYRTTPEFSQSLKATDPTNLAASTIEVERTSGPILMLAGADDGVWPSCDLAKIAMDRLTAKGHAKAHGDSSICHEHSGHRFGLPGRPTTDLYTMMGGGKVTVRGGTPAGMSRAARDADDRIRAFLRDLPVN
jgi:dienelactone hydrolase